MPSRRASWFGRGGWEYSTYQWNDEGTEGELLDERKTVEYTIHEGGEAKVLEYLFPEYDDCVTCHGPAINDVLGPKTAQINRERDYDGLVENQLVAMEEIELLDMDADEEIDPKDEPRMANPQKGEGSLDERARAYLDANCAHCHRPNGFCGLGGPRPRLRYELPIEDTGMCDPMRYFPNGPGRLVSRQGTLRDPGSCNGSPWRICCECHRSGPRRSTRSARSFSAIGSPR